MMAFGKYTRAQDEERCEINPQTTVVQMYELSHKPGMPSDLLSCRYVVPQLSRRQRAHRLRQAKKAYAPKNITPPCGVMFGH